MRTGFDIVAFQRSLAQERIRLSLPPAPPVPSGVNVPAGSGQGSPATSSGSGAVVFNPQLHPRGSGGRFLESGSSGGQVKSVQSRLGIKADGQYGPQTKAAIEAFQRAHGLQVDGVIGSQTAAALLGQKAHAVGQLTGHQLNLLNNVPAGPTPPNYYNHPQSYKAPAAPPKPPAPKKTTGPTPTQVTAIRSILAGGFDPTTFRLMLAQERTKGQKVVCPGCGKEVEFHGGADEKCPHCGASIQQASVMAYSSGVSGLNLSWADVVFDPLKHPRLKGKFTRSFSSGDTHILKATTPGSTETTYHVKQASDGTHSVEQHQRSASGGRATVSHLGSGLTGEQVVDKLTGQSSSKADARELTRPQQDTLDRLATQHGRVHVGMTSPYGDRGTREMTVPGGHSYHVNPDGHIIREGHNHSVNWAAHEPLAEPSHEFAGAKLTPDEHAAVHNAINTEQDMAHENVQEGLDSHGDDAKYAKLLGELRTKPVTAWTPEHHGALHDAINSEQDAALENIQEGFDEGGHDAKYSKDLGSARQAIMSASAAKPPRNQGLKEKDTGRHKGPQAAAQAAQDKLTSDIRTGRTKIDTRPLGPQPNQGLKDAGISAQTIKNETGNVQGGAMSPTEIRQAHDALGLQHNHLVDKQLDSNVRAIVAHVDQQKYISVGARRGGYTKGKPAKTDQQVRDRLKTFSNGRGANHYGGYTGDAATIQKLRVHLQAVGK